MTRAELHPVACASCGWAAAQADDIARLGVIINSLSRALDAAIRAPAGTVPAEAETFYDARVGRVTAERVAAFQWRE